MTGEIVKLVTSTAPPAPVDPEVVELLERLLDQAKTGQFNGIIVGTISAPALGTYTGAGTAYAGACIGAAVHTALGLAAVLRRRLENELIVWPEGPGT